MPLLDSPKKLGVIHTRLQLFINRLQRDIDGHSEIIERHITPKTELSIPEFYRGRVFENRCLIQEIKGLMEDIK